LELQPPRRYFSPVQILVGTLLGGPIAGGFLASCNHGAFGSASRGRATLLVSCLVTAALVIAGHSLADPTDAPMLAGVVAGMFGVYARLAFTAEIGQRRRQGWTQHTWWRAVGISLAFSVAMLLLAAAAVLQFGIGP
jgi:hypothetical protein